MKSRAYSRRGVALASVAALLAALTLNIAAVPAQAAQDVDIVVSGEYGTSENDLQPIQDPANRKLSALVCSGKSPKDNYEVGFQGVLDMTSVWKKWREMRTLGALASLFKPELHPDKLTLFGEWTTSLTIDPEVVTVDAEKYTVESVQAQFEEANQEKGNLFASFMRVQSVSVEDGVFKATYKLQSKNADGIYTDGLLAGELNKSGATPDKVYFPSLDDSLFVPRETVEKYAEAKKSFSATSPTVTGSLDVPRLATIYAMGINNMRPIQFTKGIGNDVPVAALTKPYIVSEVKTDAPEGVEIPAEVLAFNKEEEREISSDPETAPELPAVDTVIDTPTAKWTLKNIEKAKGVCGKRTYSMFWDYEAKPVNVTYAFQAADKAMALPGEVTNILPAKHTAQRQGSVAPTVATFKPVKVASDASAKGQPAVWFFEGWTPAKIDNANEDITFVGTWSRKVVVNPQAPTLSPAPVCEQEKTVVVKPTEGISYGETREGTTVTITATALEGYVVVEGAEVSWIFDVAGIACQKDEPQSHETAQSSEGAQSSSSTQSGASVQTVVPAKPKVAKTGANTPAVLGVAAMLIAAGGVVITRAKRR